jgi:hypothetical protein
MVATKNMKRIKEKLYVKLAWLMPKTLCFWCFIRVAAYCSVTTCAKKEVFTITTVDAIKAWEPFLK